MMCERFPGGLITVLCAESIVASTQVSLVWITRPWLTYEIEKKKKRIQPKTPIPWQLDQRILIVFFMKCIRIFHCQSKLVADHSVWGRTGKLIHKMSRRNTSQVLRLPSPWIYFLRPCRNEYGTTRPHNVPGPATKSAPELTTTANFYQ